MPLVAMDTRVRWHDKTRCPWPSWTWAACAQQKTPHGGVFCGFKRM